MKISTKVKSNILADYVIICVASSAIILLWSYMGLTLTAKLIPSEMSTLISTLAFAAVGAAALKGKTKPYSYDNGSFVNTIFMALTTSNLALVIHYNVLIWGDKVVPKEFAPMIGGLAGIILTVTNFKNSGYGTSKYASSKDDDINQ